MNYGTYKFFHILGVILLIGNVSVTSIWKVFADRTTDPSVVSFAQRLVTHTDWTLTGGGILLTTLGGYDMAWEIQISLFKIPWLLWSQVLFAISGAIWLFILIPIQILQSRMAGQFAVAGSIGDDYRRCSRLWLRWGDRCDCAAYCCALPDGHQGSLAMSAFSAVQHLRKDLLGSDNVIPIAQICASHLPRLR